MGILKNEMIEDEEAGFYKFGNDKNICSNHFDDEAIISFIDENPINSVCSYCQPLSQGVSVIALNDLMEFLCKGIYYFYDDAANVLPFESAEGGYQGDTFDTQDLISEEICLEIKDDNVREEILNHLPDRAWCKASPFTLDENKGLIYDWKGFVLLLKYKIRYSFFVTKKFNNNKYSDVSDILRVIADGVTELKLITLLSIGQEIYRSRQHSETTNTNSLKDMASPPTKSCKLPNRMSPSGIPMFYGSFDKSTAEMEVIDFQDITENPKSLQLNLC